MLNVINVIIRRVNSGILLPGMPGMPPIGPGMPPMGGIGGPMGGRPPMLRPPGGRPPNFGEF